MERTYCHGGMKPEAKGRKDGCAVLWRIWGAIGYHLETINLMESGMPAPAHFTRSDWRTSHKIKHALEAWRTDERSNHDHGSDP